MNNPETHQGGPDTSRLHPSLFGDNAEQEVNPRQPLDDIRKPGDDHCHVAVNRDIRSGLRIGRAAICAAVDDVNPWQPPETAV